MTPAFALREIEWVELSIGDDDHSHMIDPEDYMHMIMSMSTMS